VDTLPADCLQNLTEHGGSWLPADYERVKCCACGAGAVVQISRFCGDVAGVGSWRGVGRVAALRTGPGRSPRSPPAPTSAPALPVSPGQHRLGGLCVSPPRTFCSGFACDEEAGASVTVLRLLDR